MCVGGKLGKATHLRHMMGGTATFFFAGYEGGPRGLHGVPLIPSQPALQTHRSSILRAAVALNLRCERRFPGHERERPSVLQRGALITCPRLQHSAMCKVLAVCFRKEYRHPYSKSRTHFNTFRM